MDANMLQELCELTGLQPHVAAKLLPRLTPDERLAVASHVRRANLVATAAVIYRARVRLAAGDRRALEAALKEANELHLRIQQTTDIYHEPRLPQDPSPPPIYRLMDIDENHADD